MRGKTLFNCRNEWSLSTARWMVLKWWCILRISDDNCIKRIEKKCGKKRFIQLVAPLRDTNPEWIHSFRRGTWTILRNASDQISHGIRFQMAYFAAFWIRIFYSNCFRWLWIVVWYPVVRNSFALDTREGWRWTTENLPTQLIIYTWILCCR